MHSITGLGIHSLTLLKAFGENLYRKEHKELVFTNQTEAYIMSGNHITKIRKDRT